MDDIAGAREKIQRAKQHIKDFEVGFSTFLRENPQRIWHDPNDPGLQKSLFIRHADMPAPLVCVVGDAIHNMRSALDHLAFAVAKRNGVSKRGLRETDFPIRKTSGAFDKAIKDGKVAIIGVAWINFLKRIEPYCGGKCGDLYIISALDNLDKHRNLIVVDPLADTFVWNDVTQTYIAVERGLSFKDGIEVALDPADPNYHTHTRTRVVIRENIPGLDPDGWANDILDRLCDCVRRVVDAAEADARLWP